MTYNYIRLVAANTVTVNATANSIFGFSRIRLYNSDVAPALITVANAGGVNTATLIIAPNATENIYKFTGDTLIANNNTKVFATPIALGS